MNNTISWIIAGTFVALISMAVVIGEYKNDSSPRDLNSYTIVKKWELPPILTEVSDISWVDNKLVAAVQDEKGIIFMYNLKTSEITRKINFARPGDYEGLAVDGANLFVVRSDGKIFEIKNFKNENFTVQEYQTPLTEKQDIEGITFDKKNNQLLLSTKEEEPGNKNYKGIYAFDLNTKKLQSAPVYKLKFDDPIFKAINPKKKSKTIRPSEIDFHPKTGQLFVLDAKIPMLVIYNKDGDSQKIYFLDKEEFAQPEGLTFDESGNLYISNEGDDGAGNILQVALKK